MLLVNLSLPYNYMGDAVETCKKFNINTKLRQAHFFSQLDHESGGFRSLEENLNYSATGLMKTFGKYFPDKSKALTYERKPEAIASLVYGNRLGNGNEASREGWTYRGRGFIQLTGKDNYKSASEYFNIDLVNDPDKVKEMPFQISGWFWFNKNLNSFADKGSDIETIKLITRRINGGYNGLEDRTRKFRKYYGL